MGLDGGIQPTIVWPTTDIATVRKNCTAGKTALARR
jgi:hypothetical protein